MYNLWDDFSFSLGTKLRLYIFYLVLCSTLESLYFASKNTDSVDNWDFHWWYFAPRRNIQNVQNMSLLSFFLWNCGREGKSLK